MYNPFTNISDEKSIDIVVNSILVHADQQIEPVEEERLLLKTVFTYVWTQCPMVETNQVNLQTIQWNRDMESIYRLLAEFEKGTFDKRMLQLALNSYLKEEHPAYRAYKEFMSCTGEDIEIVVQFIKLNLASTIG